MKLEYWIEQGSRSANTAQASLPGLAGVRKSSSLKATPHRALGGAAHTSTSAPVNSAQVKQMDRLHGKVTIVELRSRFGFGRRLRRWD